MLEKIEITWYHYVLIKLNSYATNTTNLLNICDQIIACVSFNNHNWKLHIFDGIILAWSGIIIIDKEIILIDYGDISTLRRCYTVEVFHIK